MNRFYGFLSFAFIFLLGGFLIGKLPISWPFGLLVVLGVFVICSIIVRNLIGNQNKNEEIE